MNLFKFFFPGLLILLVSCTANKPFSDFKEEKSVPLCYFYANQRDTVNIRLFIKKNNKVEGDYTYLSGSRISSGTLEGTLKGDSINVLWIYQFGGFKTTETLKFHFNRANQQLIQLGSVPSDATPMIKVNCDQLSTLILSKIETAEQNHRIFCFMKLEGDKLQDTIALKLHILPNKHITADYIWLPKEKDARIGILSGKLEASTIKAAYQYLQEGQEQIDLLTFHLQNDTSRIVLMGNNNTDSVSLNRVNCVKMPLRLRVF